MKMKKLLSALTITALVFTLLPWLPVTNAKAALPDIVISVSGTSPGTLMEGSDFSLDITFKNNSGDSLSGILLDFSSADDVMVRSGSSVVIFPAGTLASGASAAISIPLKYTGASGNDRIPIKFLYTYADSSTGETLTYVYVNAIATTQPGPAADTSQFKPALQLSVVGANIVSAGGSSEIKVLVRNLSALFSARNIVIESKPGTDSPFMSALIAGTGIISEILPGASVEITMAVSVDLYAAVGNYPLPVTLSYSNLWSDPFSADSEISLQVVNPNTPGLIILSSAALTPDTIIAGSDFNISVKVKHEGSLPAKDIRITLEGLSADTFTLSSGSNSIFIEDIAGDAYTTVSLQLRAGAGMKSGSYPLIFNIGYADERGNKTADTQQLWIPVVKTDDQIADVMFISVTPSKTKIDPGSSVNVSVAIKNNGTSEAKQVKVMAEVQSASLYPVSQDTYIIQSLQPGETKTLTFGFQAQETAPRGSTPITIILDVPDGKGVATQTLQAVSVFQNGSAATEDPLKNVPKIIVNSYSTDPSRVKAGEKFILSLEILNTHLSKTIYNIKASFTVTESSSETGNVFTPVDSSNTIYIDSIASKEAVKRDINLYTIPDAKSKTYTITLSFEYQDKDGNPYKTEELIGVPVYQPARFEISEPNYSAETQVWQPVYTYFEMYNLGKNTLYNVKLRVEGAQSEPNSAYYGNFEAGHNEYVELNITPTEVGTTTVRIIVSYENTDGEVSESVKEITFNVTDVPIIDPTDEKPTDPDGNPIPDDSSSTGAGFFQGTLFKVIAGLLILGVIIALIMLIVGKHNNRKGIEF